MIVINVVISNKSKMVLSPENDSDRAMIKALKSQQLVASEILDKIQILDKTITEGLVIESKPNETNP